MGFGGFSWKRAIGISKAKANVSRAIGVPLTRSGRQQKLARGLGCCVVLVAVLLAALAGLCIAGSVLR